MDKVEAQGSYDENHSLILELDTRYYGSLLLCLRENLQMKQQLAEMEHEAQLDVLNQEHQQELLRHSAKLCEADDLDEEVKPPVAVPHGIPSPISAVPPEQSRGNSVFESIEVLSSPTPEASPAPSAIDPSSQKQQTKPAPGQTATESASGTAVPPAASSHTPTPKQVPKGTAGNTKKRAAEEESQPHPKRTKEDVEDGTDHAPATDQQHHTNEPAKKKKKKTAHSQPGADCKPLTERTVAFDKVANNRIYHDTIVEYPAKSGLYYILYCEEHNLHFKHKSPIGGAAKHLFAPSHGSLPKDWDVAIRNLGYLVTGCDEDKRRLHNYRVEAHFSAGGTTGPSLKTPSSTGQIERMKTPPLTNTKPSQPKSRPTAGTSAKKAKLSVAPSPQKTRGIIYPEKFHIYQARWGTGHGAAYYPVMILGWDSQDGSGLAGTLNDTQLLNENAEPPVCYIYDEPREKIIGWGSGYEDNGPRVGSRKFPVLFFDSKRSVAWVFGSNLRKYPLYDEITEPREAKQQQEVREWIARREGFTSWEQRQAAKALLNGGSQNQSTATTTIATTPATASGSAAQQHGDPDVHMDQNETDDESEGMDLDDTDSSLDCEAFHDAELKKLLEIGGEIPGDKDYTDSQETGDTDGDVEMAAVDSPSKVYRKSFITTRSTEKRKSASRSASIPAQQAPSGSSLTEGDVVTRSISQARALSYEAATKVHAGFAATEPTVATQLPRLNPDPLPAQYPSVAAHTLQQCAGVANDAVESQAHDGNDAEAARPAVDEAPTVPLAAPEATPTATPASGATKSASAVTESVAQPASMPPTVPTPQANAVPLARPSPAAPSRTTAIPATPARAQAEQPLAMGINNIKPETDRSASSVAVPPVRTTRFTPAGTETASASVSSATASPIMSSSSLARAEFTVQMYSRGAVQWEKTAPEVASIKMVADGGVLRSVAGSAVTIAVDPSTIQTFIRQNYGTDNYKMVLVPVAEGEERVEMVFGPGVGCRGETGKRQSRQFVSWMQSINSKMEASHE